MTDAARTEQPDHIKAAAAAASLDAQIAAVKTAMAAATSATERSMLKAAIATLEQVRADQRRGQAAMAELTDAARRTR